MARILIVDDQKSALLTLEGVLSRDKHAVVACTNPTDAMDKLNSEAFDLLITDAIMPGSNTGYALIRTLRLHPKLAGLPIILVTGKREKADVERGLDAGADDYVVKPVDPEILLAKVNSLLERSNPEAAKFAEAAVQAKASWEVQTEITAVSEIGVTLKSATRAAPGDKVRLNSPLLNEIGLPNPYVRIASCEPVPGHGEAAYRVQAHFIGLSEKELQPLRLWIRSKGL